MAAPLVELKGLVKRYEALARASAPTVLNGLDLELQAGESVAILGPSGCGKSTLLHIVGALLPPTAGTVRFEGTDLATLGSDELAALRNERLGYVFQSHHLLPQCSALENVLVPTLVVRDKARRAEAEARARELLAEVGLAGRTEHRPAQLSGGECQRTAVVRALINRPRLLLADEPTGSLDAAAADQLADLLCSMVERESVALLTVTHSARLAKRMQRVLELRNGTLHPAELPA